MGRSRNLPGFSTKPQFSTNRTVLTPAGEFIEVPPEGEYEENFQQKMSRD